MTTCGSSSSCAHKNSIHGAASEGKQRRTPPASLYFPLFTRRVRWGERPPTSAAVRPYPLLATTPSHAASTRNSSSAHLAPVAAKCGLK